MKWQTATAGSSRGTGFVIDKNELLNHQIQVDDENDGVERINNGIEDDDVYIVTAAHVAAPGWDIQVSLSSASDAGKRNSDNNSTIN